MTPGRPLRIGIAANDVLARAGIRGALESAGEIVAGEAHDSRGAVELARAHRPDVLLLHAALPDMDAPLTVRTVRGQVPTTRVLLVAAPHDSESLLPVLRAGGTGFLFAGVDPGELAGVVRVVAAGGTFLCRVAIERLVAYLLSEDGDRRERARRRVGVLTPREREVLSYVGMGMGNVRIARLTRLSEGSVKAYVSRILAKLRCDNRVQAALIARDAAMVPPWPEHQRAGA